VDKLPLYGKEALANSRLALAYDITAFKLSMKFRKLSV
jgi:hypothetical protein